MADTTIPPQIPVLVVGCGIVGLSAALCLAYHDVPSLVIERRSGTSVHPRARSVNARTMEIFRHLGIDGDIHDAGAAIASSKGIYTGASLRDVIGPKPRSTTERKVPFTSLFAPMSPVLGTFVTQDKSEPVLLAAAQRRGVQVRFNIECVSIEQDDDGVTATLRDRTTDTTSTVHARYLIGADGAHSPTRARLSVPTLGRGAMGHLLNILFTADLGPFVRGREFSLVKFSTPTLNGLLTSINNKDVWVFHLSYSPSHGESPADFPPDRCIPLLRAALGMPDLAITITSILPWSPTVSVAARMKQGRVFLAGDAAHTMAPWGGQGATSGIADAHNLAWKLAAVLSRRAGPALLATYDAERQPIGLEAAEASASGADERGLISVDLSADVIRGWLRKAPLISGHGYAYASRAVCEEDTGPLRGLTWKPWTLPSLLFGIDGRPGRRVPHVWGERASDGRRVSSLDLCGRAFVLFAGVEGEAWVDAARRAAEAVGVAVEAYRVGLGSGFKTEKGCFETACGISRMGAVLVRPDDFVAWRARRGEGNGREREVLEGVLRRVLCL